MKPLLSLLAAVLGAFLFVNVDGVAASSLTATSLGGMPLASGHVLQVKFDCNLVGGKLVCGRKKGGDDDKVKDDDDDDNDDANDTGLTECKIQQPGSGGGCGTGFKQVCEKMKSGKKCCDCVPDPNAEPAGDTQTQPAAPKRFSCEADVLPATVGHSYYGGIAAANEAEARSQFDAHLKQRNFTLNGPVTCKPNP